jgi:hypothetical protein
MFFCKLTAEEHFWHFGFDEVGKMTSTLTVALNMPEVCPACQRLDFHRHHIIQTKWKCPLLLDTCTEFAPRVSYPIMETERTRIHNKTDLAITYKSFYT